MQATVSNSFNIDLDFLKIKFSFTPRPLRAPQQQFGIQQQQNQFGIQQQQQQNNKFNRCGVRNSQGINGRIKNPTYVDGDSEFGEYPWQAAILKKDPKESVYVCGGTLIDSSHIITAAHCIKTYSGFDLRVRLGGENLLKELFRISF